MNFIPELFLKRMKIVDVQNFCFDGPRINPRVGWTWAEFVEGGVEH
jgi:hypothetical protein